ncbi:MAG: hypothetical protein A2096_08180 [Spirochaetes bacterium GWF1_41_5]|nr:MAG: hypothetical protein A2096_08180 [Spirochaetes bacterium GWF1_41_5]HBE02315.1 B12-binding domain-containing radical SAM protein [Spirochaetia bacterium]
MKILFCEAAQRNEKGELLKIKPMWICGITTPHLAAITPGDIEVEIQNELVEDIRFDGNYDLVAITSMGGSATLRACEISDEFRKRGKKVVMGGVPMTIFSEITQNHCDALVKGEVELMWNDIINDFRRGSLQRVYESKELHDLRGLPTPRYDLLVKKPVGPIMPIQATRGCPQPCKYCSVTAFYKQAYRMRPVDDVIRDFEVLKKMGYSRFLFIDDNILARKDYAKELFKAMIPLKIHWYSQAALPALDDENFLDLVKDSGCDLLSIGFETINQKVLNNVAKQFNHPDKYKSIIKSIKQRGIYIHTSLMFGFDEDDKTVFDDTYQFFMEAGVGLPELHILTPTPGTPLFTEMEKAGRLLHKDYTKYNPDQVVFQPKNMTPAELEYEFWHLFDRFYTPAAIFKRIVLKTTGGYLKKFIMFLMMIIINFKFRHAVTVQRRSPATV